MLEDDPIKGRLYLPSYDTRVNAREFINSFSGTPFRSFWKVVNNYRKCFAASNSNNNTQQLISGKYFKYDLDFSGDTFC